MVQTTPIVDPSFRSNPCGVDQVTTLRILHVEDNSSDRDMLAKLLAKRMSSITLAKVEFIGAATLAAGLERAQMANCTILDLALMDSPAEQTIESIRRFRPPVIVMTGTDDPAIVAACLAAGAEHVFVKGQIHGLCNAVLDCISKDLLRLNGILTPHGDATK